VHEDPGQEQQGQERRPALRVVRGQPTAAELAALVVVLERLASMATPASRPPQASEWTARSRMLRQPVAAGPGAWRASGLPR
jgi:Acyl-CoA carboxylase epsilon subunit